MQKSATARSRDPVRVTARFAGVTLLPSETIRGGEIAALLGLEQATFLRRRAQLFTLGFPRPVPGFTNVWSRRNVMAYIHGSQVAAAVPHPATRDDGPRDTIELAREALESRIGQDRLGGAR